MNPDSLKKSLKEVQIGQASIVLIQGADSEDAREIASHIRSSHISEPLHIELDGASESRIRHSFINAYCSGRSVLATGLDTLGAKEFQVAIEGLAAVGSWNKGAVAVGTSSANLSKLPDNASLVDWRPNQWPPRPKK